MKNATFLAWGAIAVLALSCGGAGGADDVPGQDHGMDSGGDAAEHDVSTDAIHDPDQGKADHGLDATTDPGVDVPRDLPVDAAFDLPGDPVGDLGPRPPGCCLDDDECGQMHPGTQMVCAGHDIQWGAAPGWGVCLATAADGRCWRDGDCDPGLVCRHAAICPCGVDCDMADGPGVCAPAGATCVPLEEEWIAETCNAASVIIFNGSECVGTCPGCCGCDPFCDLTFPSMDACESACLGADSCRYRAARAESPYLWVAESESELACPVLIPRPGPCANDGDCPADPPGYGGYCVMGNCVYCWNDSQCGDGFLCRAGRCVSASTGCEPGPPCTDDRCSLVTLSESPCPVCVCDSIYRIPCPNDVFCVSFASHLFNACVYGRCADCRSDADCIGIYSGRCLPPGICYEMTPPPHLLYGAWMIGWFGGLDHFSYFRFEPDGTLRRGAYPATDWMMDDVPPLPCHESEMSPVEPPLIGTWEPEVTASTFLVIRASLNLGCDTGSGWTTRFAINLEDDGATGTFQDIDNEYTYMGIRVPADSCTPDFATCAVPSYPVL